MRVFAAMAEVVFAPSRQGSLEGADASFSLSALLPEELLSLPQRACWALQTLPFVAEAPPLIVQEEVRQQRKAQKESATSRQMKTRPPET